MDELAHPHGCVTNHRSKFFQTAMPRAISIGWRKTRLASRTRQLWWGHQNSHLEPNLRISQAMRSAEREVDSMDEAKKWTSPTRVSNTQSDASSWVLHVCILDEDRGLETKIESLGLVRQEDVLDTGLAPHCGLIRPSVGPTRRQCWVLLSDSSLITSRDIITLWVARMVLMGLKQCRTRSLFSRSLSIQDPRWIMARQCPRARGWR